MARAGSATDWYGIEEKTLGPGTATPEQYVCPIRVSIFTA